MKRKRPDRKTDAKKNVDEKAWIQDNKLWNSALSLRNRNTNLLDIRYYEYYRNDQAEQRWEGYAREELIAELG